jgi:predicted ester cyclase
LFLPTITGTGMLIDHFSDGKIVEEWQWMDWLGLMRQLGLIPESAGE